jgi:hypothetical protein
MPQSTPSRTTIKKKTYYIEWQHLWFAVVDEKLIN